MLNWALMFFVVAIIAVGSVFLQWHYAVDGYAGMLLAAATVVLANRLPIRIPLRRRPPVPERLDVAAPSL